MTAWLEEGRKLRAEGYSFQEIADYLGQSKGNVAYHLRKVVAHKAPPPDADLAVMRPAVLLGFHSGPAERHGKHGPRATPDPAAVRAVRTFAGLSQARLAARVAPRLGRPIANVRGEIAHFEGAAEKATERRTLRVDTWQAIRGELWETYDLLCEHFGVATTNDW